MSDQEYLNIDQQEEIIRKLSCRLEIEPSTNHFCLRHGEKIAAFAMLVNGLAWWRAGFRGYGLVKFGRGRLATAILSSSLSFAGMGFHEMHVKRHVFAYFRKEDPWVYGLRSGICGAVGILFISTGSIATTFFWAQANGVLPVSNFWYKTSGERQTVLKTLTTRIKPYMRTLVFLGVYTTALMFMVGMREYTDSCELLAQENRKTLCLKE